MKTIDADAAIDALMERFKRVPTNAIIAKDVIKNLPPAQSEIIQCKDCVNHIDDRCTVANHHVAPFSCCQSVFGAKRRGDKHVN